MLRKLTSVVVVLSLILFVLPHISVAQTLNENDPYVQACAAALGVTVSEFLIMAAMVGVYIFWFMALYYGIYNQAYDDGYEQGVHDVPQLTPSQWLQLQQDPAAAAYFCATYPLHSFCNQ